MHLVAVLILGVQQGLQRVLAPRQRGALPLALPGVQDQACMRTAACVAKRFLTLHEACTH